MSGHLVSLTARGLSLSFGPTTVLGGIDLKISSGDRVGVVAPNGTGKSTLLKVLGGLLLPDDGSITLAPPMATIGYIAQEPELAAGETVREALARCTGVQLATAELDAATAALGEGMRGAEDRYAVALDRWLHLGGADFDARVEEACEDLGLGVGLLDRGASFLSGGQAARVSLATILLSQHGVLLLDEPTNNLDFEGLDRLERFVGEAGAAMVIVSHDRAFLARTITSVLELDQHDHGGVLYNGGWEAFLHERATARRQAEEAFDTYQSTRRDLEARVRTQRQWAVAGKQRAGKRPTDNDKAQRDFRLDRTEKQAAKVRISEKALARLDPIEKPWEGWDLRFEIEAGRRSGDVVVRLDRAVIQRGELRLGPIDLELRWAERVAVLGPNGSGKSTLLDAILGRVPLSEGTRSFGASVVVGELDQTRSLLGDDASLLASFQAATGLPVADARSLLAKFDLGADDVLRPAGSLSPGERTRAVLATFMARGVNCLVLDEPTNHLDLEAIEQLERALATWNGTLLLVTHDRALLDAVTIDRTVQLPSPGDTGSEVRDDARMTFKGWPVDAVEFYEELQADNTKTFWQEHKSVYERCVKGPMEELLGELSDDFGVGRVFRPYRDVRFSKDKTPYKLNCAAQLPGGYVSFSADGLFAGSGLYMPAPDQLQRFRAAIDDERSGAELESIVATLRKSRYDVGAHEVLKTAPKGYAKDHPRIELLKHKGVVMSRSWPVGAWLGTRKAMDRVFVCLEAARPLNAWLERYVG